MLPENKYVLPGWEKFLNQPPVQPPNVAQQIEQMPLSEKLTGSERWIYGKLPGFSQGKVGKALAWFGGTWAGKLLSKIDLPAEGIERSLGLIAQMSEKKPGEELDLARAWQAGSLFYDVSNLPTLKKDASGKITGFSVPTDLPGVDYLKYARAKLDAGVPLEQVRAEYYGNIGALSLRAQLYDTYGHIVLDPLNYILPAIKPIERMQAARKLIMATKVDVGALEKIVQTSTDVEEIAKASAALAKVTAGEAKALSTFDKFAMLITGGDELKPGFFSKGIVGKLNPLSLRPESRAMELNTMVTDHIGAQIIAKHSDDPVAVVDALDSAMRGGLGSDYGTAFLTIEGRTAQGLLGGISAKAHAMLDVREMTTADRGIMEAIANVVNDTPTNIVKEMEENAPRLMEKLTAHPNLATSPALVDAIQRGELTAETLAEAGKVLKQTPYTTSLWMHELQNGIEDFAMQQGIIMFGVKNRGFITRWANAVKSAESLAFLRLNPTYFMRNWVNNDITMLARGVFGTMSTPQIDELWDTLGWIPRRLNQGFGAAQEEYKAGKAAQLLEKALSGEKGAPERIQNFFKSVNLGGLDASRWSSRAEAIASKRAMTTGYTEWWRNYSKFDEFEKVAQPEVVTAMRQLDPDLPRLIHDAARNSLGKEAEFINKVTKGNLRVNFSTVLDDASAKLGFDISEVLSPDIIEPMARGIDEAIKTKNLDNFFFEFRNSVQNYLDEIADNNIKNLAGMIEQEVKAGGPNAAMNRLGQAIDAFHQGHSEYAIRMSTLRDTVFAGDFENAGVIWEKLFKDNDKYYTRVYNRMEATLEGIEKGAKDAGLTLPPDLRSNFKQIKDGWRDFFKYREGERKKLIDVQKAGGKYSKTWDQIDAELDTRYQNMLTLEDNTYRSMDNSAASLLDEKLKQAFLAWRNTAAELRMDDGKRVIEFIKTMRSTAPDLRPEVAKKFWQDRFLRYSGMQRVDNAGIDMMQGSPEALQAFSREAVANENRRLASEFGIATEFGTEAKRKPSDEWLMSAIKKYLPEDYVLDKKAELADIPNDVVRQAMERMATEKGVEAIPKATKGISRRAELFREKLYAKSALEGGEVSPDIGYSWRSMGEKEYQGLLSGKSTKTEAERGGYWSWFPEKSANMKGKKGSPKYLIEVNVPSEGESLTRSASLSDITGIWKSEGEEWVLQQIPELPKVTPEIAKVTQKTFLANIYDIVPQQKPMELGLDQLMFGRGFGAIDAIEDGIKAQVAKPRLAFSHLPKDAQDEILKYIERMKGQMGDNRYAAVRFGEFRRDSALLNYNRRTNFDAWLGNAAPFAFWTTGSIGKWALSSLDRPAMLSTYLRTKKFAETAGLPNKGMPSRLRGSFRVKLPFLPEWMGDQFVDPLRLILPFDAFAQPFEQAQQNQFTLDGRVKIILDERLDNNEITQADYDSAIQLKTGNLWDSAVSQAQEADEELKFNALDFASLVSSPHAPLMWAYNAARGHPEDTGPFMPLSRNIKDVATLLGIKDWSNNPANLEGRVRKELGLPAFDKWDDYRVDRMLSNMASEGKYTVDEIQRAMIDRQGDIYQEAVTRANQEMTGGISGFTLKMLGIPVKSYPEGERTQRSLQEEFSRAYEAKDKAEKQVEDYLEGVEAYKGAKKMTEEEALKIFAKNHPEVLEQADILTKFFDKHPEYETRLGLFDKPEERLRKFLIDDLWQTYNSYPDLNKREIRDQLGDEFNDQFLNKDTRSYDSISPEQLQVWLKLMGGDPPGTLTSDKKMLLALSGTLRFTAPETAMRTQVFYNTRTEQFPDWYATQESYFKLTKGEERSKYLVQHPELKQYWDWRRDFMMRNPAIVPYLTDNEADIKKYAEVAKNVPNAPRYSWQEWRNILPLPTQRILADYFTNGEALPAAAEEQLDYFSEQMGITTDELLQAIDLSLQR